MNADQKWAKYKCYETAPRELREKGIHPSNKITNIRRRAWRARDGRQKYLVTCPASRHVYMMADALSQGDRVYRMFIEEPEHCAGALYSVCSSVWKLRAEVKDLREKLLLAKNSA